MHRAQQYAVTKLNLQTLQAICRPVSVGYYTRANNHGSVTIVRRLASRCFSCRHVDHGDKGTSADEASSQNLTGDSRRVRDEVDVALGGAAALVADPICMGQVQLSSTIHGYSKVSLSTGRLLELGSCSLPPLEYDTTAFWIDLPANVLALLKTASHGAAASIHAANHALVGTAQLVALCDSNDIGCPHPSEHASGIESSRVLIFDTRPGGIGIAETLYDARVEMLHQARDFMAHCSCTNGCLSCIFDHTCPMRNHNMDKHGGIIVLEGVLAMLWEESASVANVGSGTGTGTGTGRRRGGGCGGGGGGGGGDEDSPRKVRRRQTIQYSKSLSGSRDKGMQVQKPWVDSIVLFTAESDGP